MPGGFVDAAAWIALVNTRDSLHKAAWQVFDRLERQKVPLITSEFVLLEVADALSSPPLRARAIAFLNGLRQRPLLEIVPATAEAFEDGWALYCRRPDKEWSLTDCISFAIMARRGIVDAFTSDHHFEQAGYRKLL